MEIDQIIGLRCDRSFCKAKRQVLDENLVTEKVAKKEEDRGLDKTDEKRWAIEIRGGFRSYSIHTIKQNLTRMA